MNYNRLLTPSGRKKLEEELESLKKKRIEVAQKIKEAKELGDLSENAEYHTAKEEQGFIESRIAEVESILKNATIVKPSSSKSKVSIGSKVKIKIGNQIQEFEIVGLNEADPSSGKISVDSPIGSAIMNAKKGNTVEVSVPARKMKVKVIDIK